MVMNTVISIRTNSKLKKQAQKKLSEFGLTLSSAFNLYMNDIVYGRTNPSSDARYVKREIMEKWEKDIKWAKKHSKPFNSVEELMKDLLN